MILAAAVTFDGSVTLGNLLSGLMVVLAVAGFYAKLQQRLALLEFKVDQLWTWKRAERVP